jgi:hypothetical protein
LVHVRLRINSGALNQTKVKYQQQQTKDVCTSSTVRYSGIIDMAQDVSIHVLKLVLVSSLGD